MSFSVPPEPLTHRQLIVLSIVTALVAITRVWALSRSMWEWDEALFCLALRDYNVVEHQPHPPGFPLFIGAAKLLRFCMGSDFRSLQMVTLLGAVLLFPATFLLARELRFCFSTSILGALLYVFAANVWYYGGTAFSDIAATTAMIAANVLLLRGCRDPRSYIAGAVLVGITIGFRPHLLLGCLAALILATLRQSPRRVVGAGVIVATVVAASYLGAAVATGSIGKFIEANIGQGHYVGQTDSFLNPGRPRLDRLLLDFFVKTIRGPRNAMFLVGVFSIIAVATSARRRAVNIWILVLVFLPLNIVSWLMLDIDATSRYAVSYAAMYAILAAEGARVLAEPLRPRRLSAAAQAVVMLALTFHIVWWAVPAMQQVRSKPAPPAAAMEWIVENVPRTAARIHVYDGVGPFAAYYLSEYDIAYFPARHPLPEVTFERTHYRVIDERSAAPGAHNFSFASDALLRTARQRYFHASVVPLGNMVRFGSGWFETEKAASSAWRWMGPRGVLILSPVASPASLTLKYRIPPLKTWKAPVVSLFFNGELVSRQEGKEGVNETAAIVTSRSDAPNEAVITVDQATAPSPDEPRSLALQLFSYTWTPVPRQPKMP